jgi:predicted Zn finger-like uncharacterized protein
MPEIVQCPQCVRQLRVPDDLLGKKVKCPTCGSNFVAEAPPAPESAPASAPPAPQPSPPGDQTADRPPQYDDDYADDDRPLSPPRGHRRDATPHRGPLILIIGILSIVTGLGVILGPIGWIMGSHDLKEIRAGRMDFEGEGPTNAGMICGIIGTALGVLSLCGCGLGFLGMMSELWE